jgi:hypothetical protein
MHVLLQGTVHHTVPLDQHLILERITYDGYLEMGFRARCDIMQVAFIFDLQKIGIIFASEFIFDIGLN